MGTFRRRKYHPCRLVANGAAQFIPPKLKSNTKAPKSYSNAGTSTTPLPWLHFYAAYPLLKAHRVHETCGSSLAPPPPERNFYASSPRPAMAMNTWATAIICSWLIFGIMATVAVGLRLWSRRIQKLRLSFNDYAIMMALIWLISRTTARIRAMVDKLLIRCGYTASSLCLLSVRYVQERSTCNRLTIPRHLRIRPGR